MNGNQSSLEYRIAELERKLSKVIIYGTIAVLDEDKARVRVNYDEHEGENVQTGWLPWATLRAGPDKEWWTPEESEQVLILSPAGDLAQGTVLPALYSDQFPPNGNDRNIHRVDYKNGDYIEHNRKTGTYTLKMKKFRLIGPVEQSGGDITSDGVSAQHHTHPGINPGAESTLEPNK